MNCDHAVDVVQLMSGEDTDGRSDARTKNNDAKLKERTMLCRQNAEGNETYHLAGAKVNDSEGASGLRWQLKCDQNATSPSNGCAEPLRIPRFCKY